MNEVNHNNKEIDNPEKDNISKNLEMESPEKFLRKLDEAKDMVEKVDSDKIDTTEHVGKDSKDVGKYILVGNKVYKIDNNGNKVEIDINKELQNIEKLTKGDLSVELIPNSTYEVNGRNYITDENGKIRFDDLDDMKALLGKSYKDIKADKPMNSPNISKWFENGGTIIIEINDGKTVWTYTDSEGRSVQYIDGKIIFPQEAKHPIIEDINIGHFTGDRNEDIRLYKEKLKEEYELTDIPKGYCVHHDSKNGILQLVKEDYHKEFTHVGGHSMYKEGE